MKEQPLPFDNAFTSQSGFVARQALNNDRYHRLFTWEFSRSCDSFITLPITTMPLPTETSTVYQPGEWGEFQCGSRFAELLAKKALARSTVLNLNMLVTLLMGMLAKHRRLARSAGVGGPFYIKAVLENTWRVVPFIDLESYVSQVETFDVPVVQDSEVVAPIGDWPVGFIIAPEISISASEKEIAEDHSPILVWIVIMQALGIPPEVLMDNKNIIQAANEETARHQKRIADSQE